MLRGRFDGSTATTGSTAEEGRSWSCRSKKASTRGRQLRLRGARKIPGRAVGVYSAATPMVHAAGVWSAAHREQAVVRGDQRGRKQAGTTGETQVKVG